MCAFACALSKSERSALKSIPVWFYKRQEPSARLFLMLNSCLLRQNCPDHGRIHFRPPVTVVQKPFLEYLLMQAGAVESHRHRTTKHSRLYGIWPADR